MPQRKIIIDTDPGQDDAVAILLALASPEEIEVLGILAPMDYFKQLNFRRTTSLETITADSNRRHLEKVRQGERHRC